MMINKYLENINHLLPNPQEMHLRYDLFFIILFKLVSLKRNKINSKDIPI